MDMHDKDRLTIAQRVAEAIVMLAMIGMIGFFAFHQQVNSGFFTEKFGSLDAFWFFGPMIAGLIAPAVRVWTGNRNPARPFEIITSLFLAFGALYLLSAFPFSFAHLADTLPQGIRFILAWFSDDIGKIVIILQIVFCPISALVSVWRYFSRRRQEFSHSY
ncbi:MAG: hypothetical protein U0521_16500 [Anaerolineae bacterium]